MGTQNAIYRIQNMCSVALLTGNSDKLQTLFDILKDSTVMFWIRLSPSKWRMWPQDCVGSMSQFVLKSKLGELN